MSKQIKRFIATFLAVVLFVGSAPLSGFTDIDWVNIFSTKAMAATSTDFCYSISNNVATITGYLGGGEKEIIIPSEIDGYPVEAVDLFYHQGEYEHNYYVNSVTFAEGIKEIKGTCCFYYDAVTSIRIPASVTKIEEGCFNWSRDTLKYIYVDPQNQKYISSSNVLYTRDKTCLLIYPGSKTVTSYTIPNTVTRIAQYAFYKTQYLKDIIIPNSVKTIGRDAFYYSSVENITMPDDPNILCDVIDNKTQSEFNNVFDQSAFYKNKNNYQNGILYLNSIVLYSSSDISGNIIIKDGTTAICSKAFEGRKINSIEFPESLKIIGNEAFYQSTLSQRIILPNNISFIGERAFADTKITEVNIPPTAFDAGKKRAFAYCDNLIRIFCAEGLSKIPGDTFCRANNIKELILPTSIKTIDDTAFGYMGTLNPITIYYQGIATDWKQINIDYASLSSLHGNNRIKNSTIIYNYKYTYSDGAYQYQLDSNNQATIVGHDSSLSGSITLPDTLGGYPVVGIGEGAIGGKITNVTIPAGVSSISDKAFINAKKLFMISVVSDNEYYCSDAWGVLYNKDKSVLLACPAASVMPSYCIPQSVETFSASAFENCKNLYNISVSPLNKYLSNDIYGVIFDKNKVRLIYYPKYNTRTKYTVPNTVINIAEYAFSGAANLKEITIPESVKAIGENALNNMSALKDVFYDGSESSWKEISKALCGLPSVVKVHYGKSSSYNLNEEEYINQHLMFAGANSMGENFGFYNAVWEDAPNKWLKTEAAYMNGIIGDVGEIMTFKFDDLTISADYYD